MGSVYHPRGKKRKLTKKQRELEDITRELERNPDAVLWMEYDKTSGDGQKFEKLFIGERETCWVRCARDTCIAHLDIEDQLMKNPAKVTLTKHCNKHKEIDQNANPEFRWSSGMGI
jgi:hypothetical protein